MTSINTFSDAGRYYVGGVVAVGIVIVLHSLYRVSIESIGPQWFVLAGLTLLSGSYTIRIPTIPARLSVSETFVFAAAILFGPSAATIIVVLDSLVISFWQGNWSRRFSRVLFNMAAPAVAIWCATHVFFAIAEISPLYQAPRPILSLAMPLLVLALVYFLLNSWLIAGAVGFEKHVSPFVVWRDNFLWLSLNYFSGASVAALLLPYLQIDLENEHTSAIIRVASILLPLLLISYLTFKTALGRVDDANRHLIQLNRLYLSTIETLAMAIDAKDQITHGHIRRVQQYAVGLASRIGITDAAQIHAIEAASLLHDMGKLAVPEYILNKPGKLTPAEFEKMKLHASVGADILSAIEFPYPVVPIVRHHHENWDGTGYPDRIRGTDIPIGARILSVVDCFDALTSDRPYRPRLSDADAIKILVERRGTMYDPLVVDTFIQTYTEIAPPQTSENPERASDFAHHFTSLEPRNAGGKGLDVISSSTEEMSVLFDLAQGISGCRTIADAADLVAKHLRRLIPTSLSVIYLHDHVSDELEVYHSVGEHADHFSGLKIQRGERLTGWVAANRQSIVNSDPILDLGEVARGLQPRLRSCLSTPLLHDDVLVGVLSLYSVRSEAFTENHRRVAEIVARQIAPTIRHAMQSDLANRSHTRPLQVSARSVHDLALAAHSGHLSIAVIELAGPRRSEFHERYIAKVAETVKSGLRAADVLFRNEHDEFVALLGGTSSDAATQVVRRIAERLREQEPGFERMTIVLGTASTPRDGVTIDSLIAAAKARREPLRRFTGDDTSSIH